jgi:hypothetical protein
MGFPRFYVVFRLAAPAINLFVKHPRRAAFQIGDDEARIWSISADLDARDDLLDAAPALGAVVE